MTIKPFAIQGSDLTLGGVSLQAGSNGVVIPGITQATNYFAEEVDERDGANPDTFGSDAGAVTVIDNAEYLYLVDDGDSPSADYVAATYSVDELDDGQIEEINVETGGVFLSADLANIDRGNMWATTTPTPFVSFNTANWTEIPYRPKMRAGDVENVGGGGVVDRAVSFPNGEDSDTEGTLANDNGVLYFCTADYTDLNTYINTPFSLETSENFLIGQTDGTINSATILRNANADVLFILQNGGTTASDWSITMADSDFGGAQTCTDVGFNVDNNIYFHWPHRNDDPNSIPEDSPFTVTYTGTLDRPAIWERVIGGNLIEYFDEVLNYTSSVELTGNFRVDVDDAHLYVDGDGSWSLGSDNYDTKIFSTDNTTPDPADIIVRANDNDWLFDSEGNLTLPTGGDILDSNGNSVLGGGTAVDQNVWVQTFETDAPTTDIVQLATSVEYDGNGNIIALFAHYNDSVGELNGSTYYSVGKYTTTGAKIWTARLLNSFYTDGWGLAVDTVGNWIYVAGVSNTDEVGDYNLSLLTKFDGDNGSVEWSKSYDFGFGCQSPVVDVDSESNPIVVGYADNGDDNYVTTTKINADTGEVIWSRALDGQGAEEAYGMAVGPTGEVVTVGYMDQLGILDVAATLYADPVSNVNWTINQTGVFDGGGGVGITFDVSFVAGVPTFANVSDTEGGRTLDGTVATILGSVLGGADGTDNMVVKVETLAANDTDDRMLVVKYNTLGAIQWQKAILFDEGFDCSGADADIDSAGNIYVCGQYESDTNEGPVGQAMSIVKFNSSGVKQWMRRVDGNCDGWTSSIVVGPDDKLYLSATTFAGTDSNDLDISTVLAKYNLDGTVAWQRLLDYTEGLSFGNFGFVYGPGGLVGSGSNLAVKQGYVAVGLAFSSEFSGDPEDIRAAVAQVSAAGDVFTVGSWDFKAANFSGTLDDDASEITVVDAGKTDLELSSGVDGDITTTTVTPMSDVDDFLLGTLYTSGGADERLVNGANQLVLEANGALTLPAGGTISEGVVTSNPTIQLTPASPDVASQKLVIKGGGSYSNTENGIDLGTYNITWAVSDTVEFYVYDPTRANETLYWWIVPEGAGISVTMSGTVALDGIGDGNFTFTLDSDAYEFRVRVSPTEDTYDPESIGVESVLMNGDAPAYGDYHLHLTTGDLTETSIFLGTDDHNVRTTTDGKIQITTFVNSYTVNNVWEFGTDGTTTFPENTIKNLANTSIKIGNPLVSGVVVATVDELIPPGDVWRLFIDSDIYPALGTTVHIGGTVTTAWGTPITATITDIQQDNNTDRWIILVDQDITAGFDASVDKTVSFAESYKTWSFGTDGTLTFPNATTQTTAYPGVLVPADGDSTSGTANLVFYDGAWKNTSKVGINPATGFLTIAGTGGTGGIILPNQATISAIDIGFSFISTSNGPGGVAVQENSLTVGIANPTVIASLSANPSNHRISFNGGLNNVVIGGFSGPQGGTNIYTITGTWPENATGFPITITSNDYIDGITEVVSDNGVIVETSGGSWTFGSDGDLTLPTTGDIVNGAGESFLKDIPQNYPTGYSEGVYALQASDRGRHILIDGSEGTSIGVPTDATEPMPIGSAIVLVIKPGDYNVFVSVEDDTAMVFHGAGVGSNGAFQIDAGNGGAMATLVKIGANEWMISGTGLAEYTGP
jgi:hypothetical protein